MSSYVIPVFPAASRVPPRDALAARLAELTGRFAELSSELAAISSAVASVSGKADKAPPAAAGNLASLDASGNLSDSGATPASIKAAAVAEVVANAPGTMDTLKEIADILGSSQESGTVLKRISDLESGKADESDVNPLLFRQWYPDGSVTSASQFTQGLKYEFDTTNHTASVKPFCNTVDSENDNSDVIGDVVIPPYVESNGVRYVVSAVLGGEVYGYNSNLTSINAPTTVKSIGASAFATSDSLASVSLPSATSIGDGAFAACTSLASVSLPSATIFGYGSFHSCTSLASVSLPSATSVGGEAFYSCTSLASVSLPSATSVGGEAFYSCTSLASASLPSATSIGDFAFYSCTSLTSVSLPSATSVGDSAFASCTSLASASLPSATNIGAAAFASCTSLTSVSLPSATSVGGDAFYSCTSLASASLPSATSVGDIAFASCTSLASVTLPSATSVGDYAFYSCTSLALVDFGKDARSSVPSLGTDAFSGITTNQLTFVVPDSNYNAWIAESRWSSLYNAGAKFVKYSEWEAPHRYELDAKASLSDLPYALVTKTPVNGAVTLSDRAGNKVTMDSSATLQLPPPVAGRMRDLAVRLTLVADANDDVPSPAFDGSVDWETEGGVSFDFSAAGTYILRMTETAEAVPASGNNAAVPAKFFAQCTQVAEMGSAT